MTEPIRIINDLTIESFLASAGPLLEKSEDIYGLPLGLAEALRTARPARAPHLIRLLRHGETLAIAMQTPPMNLVLSEADDSLLRELTRFLHSENARFPGVVGPPATAETFARLWSAAIGGGYELGMAQKIYRLDRVIFPAKVPGSFRVGRAKDVARIEAWFVAFAEESLPAGDGRTRADWRAFAAKAVENGHVFLWEDGGKTVAMANVSRPTRNGISINGVYTPPEHRRRGYASAVVAHLSQKMLDEGKKFCVLYTDLANPTSNKIYREIGYREVAESRHYVFTQNATA